MPLPPPPETLSSLLAPLRGQARRLVIFSQDTLTLPTWDDTPILVTTNPCRALQPRDAMIVLPWRFPPIRRVERLMESLTTTRPTNVIAPHPSLHLSLAQQWRTVGTPFGDTPGSPSPRRLLSTYIDDPTASRVVFTEPPLVTAWSRCWNVEDVYVVGRDRLVPSRYDTLERILRRCYQFPGHAVSPAWLAQQLSRHPTTVLHDIWWLEWLGCLQRIGVHLTTIHIDRSPHPEWPQGRWTLHALCERRKGTPEAVLNDLRASGVRYIVGPEQVQTGLLWKQPLTLERYTIGVKALVEQQSLFGSLGIDSGSVITDYLTARAEKHSHTTGAQSVLCTGGSVVWLPQSPALTFYQGTADDVREVGHGNAERRSLRGQRPRQRRRQRAKAREK